MVCVIHTTTILLELLVFYAINFHQKFLSFSCRKIYLCLKKYRCCYFLWLQLTLANFYFQAALFHNSSVNAYFSIPLRSVPYKREHLRVHTLRERFQKSIPCRERYSVNVWQNHSKQQLWNVAEANRCCIIPRLSR